MKLKKFTLALLILSSFCAVNNVMAHHSFAMFDRDREVVIDGSVVRWAYNSPHVALYIETAEGTLYSLEGAAPAALIARPPGMNGFTFQPGDNVRVVYCPLRDGRNGGALGIIIVDGTFYRPNDGGCGPSPDWQEWLEAGYMSKQEAEAMD